MFRRNTLLIFLAALLLLCATGILVQRPAWLPSNTSKLAQTPTDTVNATQRAQQEREALIRQLCDSLSNDAVVLYLDQTPLLTLTNQEAAQQAVRFYLQNQLSQLPQGYVGIQAQTQGELSCFDARQTLGQSQSLSEDALRFFAAPMDAADAQAYLQSHPDLCPVLVTARTIEYTEIPYETQPAEETDFIASGDRLVTILGRPGYVYTQTELGFCNGIAVTEPLVRTASLDPITEQVQTGTYRSSRPQREPGKYEGEKGPACGVLDFQKPVKGDICSNFGTREYEMHYGLDYSASAGTQVTACEDGVVVYAGSRGSYGGVVDIDHGNGFISRVACVTDLLVTVGDQVQQGQPIASVAEVNKLETPDREPHVHFEILVEGIPYNPRYYL